MTKCRKCGAELIGIITPLCKVIPCDITPIFYKVGESNEDRLLSANGKTIACEIQADSYDADGYGYMPHKNTCEGRR
ncbi:MAG: hypothetical protein VB031_02390 [Eubacteriaceae bacterium]|nr:hypothetical protein [Eubacteriaceae bacterium]